MRIEQADIAHLSDNDLKRMVRTITEARTPSSALEDFYRRLAVALVAATRERRRMVLMAEAELMNDDGPGVLVAADVDPAVEALNELRRGIWRDATRFDDGSVGDVS